MTAWSIAETAQGVRDLDRARHRCRRRRPGSRPVGTVGRRLAIGAAGRSAPPPVRVPQAARLRLEHPVHQRRVVEEDALDRRPGQDERPQRARRDDVGAGRLAEEDRDLAEEVAAGERRPLLAVDDDRRLAVEDDVERRAGEALAEDRAPRPGRPPPRTCGRSARAGASSGPRTARSRRSGRRSRRGWPSSVVPLYRALWTAF